MTLAQQLLLPTADERPAWEAFLVRHWKFDETDNGVALDSTGRSSGLTAENSPTSAAGKVGTSRLLAAASSQSFSEADTADLAFDSATSWEINGWVYPTSLASAFIIAAKGAVGGENLFLNIMSTGRLRLEYFNDGAGIGIDLLTGVGSIVVNTWYFVRAWVNPSVGTHGTAYISLDNGTAVSGALSGPSTTNTGSFFVGKRANNTFRASARFDAFRVFKGHNVTTHGAAMGTYYYNGGSGR